MMASGHETRFRRFVGRLAPFLFKKCPAGNRHWAWATTCWCQLNEYGGEWNWHGGVYYFPTDQETYFYINDLLEMPVRRRVRFKGTKLGAFMVITWLVVTAAAVSGILALGYLLGGW